MSGDDQPTLYRDGGGGPEAPEEPTDFNPPIIAAECIDPANAAKITDAAKKMVDQVARLTPLIRMLADNKVIVFKDGTSMSGAQLKDLWNKADFLVTDRTFGTDRGGAVEEKLSKINMDVALGRNAHTNGLAFIILHEVMHMTSTAVSYDIMSWNTHLAFGGTAANYGAGSQISLLMRNL